MGRQTVALILGSLVSVLSAMALVGAQDTNLAKGVYVDQLTGFSVTWNPEIFTGDLADVGGVRLEGPGSTGVLLTSSAASAGECLKRVQTSDPLETPQQGEALSAPLLPDGSVSEFGLDQGTVFRACIADPSNPTGTSFILLTLTGSEDAIEWNAAIGGWQEVIDSIRFPDPALLTTMGINGNVYTDPLYGWSVVFDPLRYEAQYAAGSADSPFLSGLYLYSEETGESGGVWAERHESLEDCLEAQRSVHAELPEFGEVPEGDQFTPPDDRVWSGTWRFTVEPDGRFIVYAGCQQLTDGGQEVENVYLVSTFTVPEGGYPAAKDAWTALLTSRRFRTSEPNGTPFS